MDRVFLEYYEEELTHIRSLAAEFADMHPAVARNLSLDTVPCPDPYVERLLDGVAYLAARTRLKVDAERSRFARSILEVLYPDLLTPAPATTMAVLKPGQQVQTMNTGHVVARGTRLVSSLQPGLSTRLTFTTVQDVTLWPVEIASVGYFQDRSALATAGVTPPAGVPAEAAFRITLTRAGKGKLSDLALDRLDPRRLDQIGLGDCDDGLADAEQASDGDMLVRLGHYAVISRDDEQQEVDAGSAGQHRVDEFLMAGHVDEADDRAVCLGPISEAERDRDAARLLLFQTVGIDAGQPPDQRGLAMVDMAGGSDDHGAVSAGETAARAALMKGAASELPLPSAESSSASARSALAGTPWPSRVAAPSMASESGSPAAMPRCHHRAAALASRSTPSAS